VNVMGSCADCATSSRFVATSRARSTLINRRKPPESSPARKSARNTTALAKKYVPHGCRPGLEGLLRRTGNLQGGTIYGSFEFFCDILEFDFLCAGP
jgi:hypothetical protein